MRVSWKCLALASLALAACAGATPEERQRATRVSMLTADVAAGEAGYASSCAVCHGANARGGLARDLRSAAMGSTEDFVVALIRGPESMPAFDSWSDQQMADVIAHVRASTR